MPRLRLLALSLLLCLVAPFLPAQNYTSLVVFGDSLSDTGNIAALTQSSFGVRYPGPLFDYTDGRFTDGTDTTPAASAHAGVWVEQLAAMLPTHPAVSASLVGGTDYAYGDATTANGTTTVTETTGISITLNNMGQQVTDYLTAHPTVPAGTLVILWGGSNDLGALARSLGTNPDLTMLQTEVQGFANNEIALAQRLIAAGATDILLVNLPPLGDTPDFNTDAALMQLANLGASTFNTALQTGINGLPAANPGVTLHLFQLDTFSLFNTVIASPGAVGLTNVTVMAQHQAVNPDQYLFWDDLHPTTTGHYLLAMKAASVLAPAPIASTTTLTSSAATANLGSSITFTATVSAAAGLPTGTVTFLDGTTTLGTGTLAAAGTTSATATFATSSLAAGAHTITASFAGSTGLLASTSAALTETVVAPAITVTASPTTVTVAAGSTGTTTLTVTPVGGFNGSVTFACQNVPANAFCTTGALPQIISTPTTFTLSLFTNGKAPPIPAALIPLSFTSSGAALIGLVALLTVGLLHFTRRRTRLPRTGLLALALVLSAAAALGLNGCGGGSNSNTARGTYTIPVVATPTPGSAVTTNITLVVQ